MDPYDDVKYVPGRAFVAPTSVRLDELVQRFHQLSVQQAVDPDQKMDNRIAVRILMWKFTDKKISGELLMRLAEPYDNGYYKKSDGKSTPFRWWAVNKDQERAGIKKDIVSVRHDLDYYRGEPRRVEADLFYLLSQHCIGSNRVLATLEYIALRVFGFYAWSKHQKKRIALRGKYGTDDYIKKLPDIDPQLTKRGGSLKRAAAEMNAFLSRVLDAYKSGEISKESAVGGLAHVMAALDIQNIPEAEAIAWFNQDGVKQRLTNRSSGRR